MKVKEMYKGYKAYQYLEKDKDYKSFKMSDQVEKLFKYHSMIILP